jgi:hypothetical protein
MARSLRRVLLAAITVVLAAILGYLYLKTGANFKQQNEVLADELKEFDSRWDVDILRVHTEVTPPQSLPPDQGATLARIERELTAASEALGSPVLARGLPDLAAALAQKAAMLEKFRQANAAARQALAEVVASDVEIAGLVRGSWRDFRERERLVAPEAPRSPDRRIPALLLHAERRAPRCHRIHPRRPAQGRAARAAGAALGARAPRSPGARAAGDEACRAGVVRAPQLHDRRPAHRQRDRGLLA